MVLKLNNCHSLQVIHCDVPTSTAVNVAEEKLYEAITQAKNLEKRHHSSSQMISMQKIGRRQQNDPDYIGNFGRGNRNMAQNGWPG